MGSFDTLHVSAAQISHHQVRNKYTNILETRGLSLQTIGINFSQYLTKLMHKICFTVSFVSCLYMFRAYVAHHQEVKIALHSLWYHHTYTCDDTRGYVMQFPDPSKMHIASSV